MTKKELREYIEESWPNLTADDKVMIRIGGKLYKVDGISNGIYGNIPIMIIEAKEEGK